MVVGKDYVDKQRAVLSHYDFNIEILNKGDTKDLPKLFYYKYKERLHNYRMLNMDDVDTTQPLDLCIDFGGHFSCMPVSQDIDNEVRFVYEFDTEKLTTEEKDKGVVKKLPQVINDFTTTFSNHQNKHVQVWGDRMGTKKMDPMDAMTWFEKVAMWLNAASWTCDIMVMDDHSAMHKSRWLFLNDIFAETTDHYPKIRINEITCPHMILSLNNTNITDDFKKDKRHEGKEGYPQEEEPHYTDAMDYKVFNKYLYLLNLAGSGSSLGGMNEFI